MVVVEGDVPPDPLNNHELVVTVRTDRTLQPEKPWADLLDPSTKQIHKLRFVNRPLPPNCVCRVAVALVAMLMPGRDQALALPVAVLDQKKCPW